MLCAPTSSTRSTSGHYLEKPRTHAQRLIAQEIVTTVALNKPTHEKVREWISGFDTRDLFELNRLLRTPTHTPTICNFLEPEKCAHASKVLKVVANVDSSQRALIYKEISTIICGLIHERNTIYPTLSSLA